MIVEDNTIVKLITDEFLPVYAALMVAIAGLGLSFKFVRYGWLRLTLPSEMTRRTETPFPAQGLSWSKAVWIQNADVYNRFWMRANPVTFAGHVLYHSGLFLAMGIYAVIAFLSRGLEVGSMWNRTLLICEWFIRKGEVFGPNGASPALGNALYWLFFVALLSAVTGMAIPFVMTALNKRGMQRPLDSALLEAGIEATESPRVANTTGGKQRKLIGLIVLVMDAAMLSTYFFPSLVEVNCLIHVGFAFTIVGLLPMSFLFHEIYRLRMLAGVRRLVDGRVA